LQMLCFIVEAIDSDSIFANNDSGIMFDIGWLTSLKSNVLQNEPSLYGHTSKITIRRITSCCVSERNLITSKIELRDFQVLHFVRRASASSSLLIGV